MIPLHKLAPPLAGIVLLAAPSPSAGADEGEKLFVESCSSCHNAKTRPLEAKRLSREAWSKAIEHMEEMGAEVPGGEKRSRLLDYLVRTHGPDSPGALAPDAKK